MAGGILGTSEDRHTRRFSIRGLRGGDRLHARLDSTAFRRLQRAPAWKGRQPHGPRGDAQEACYTARSNIGLSRAGQNHTHHARSNIGLYSQPFNQLLAEQGSGSTCAIWREWFESMVRDLVVQARQLAAATKEPMDFVQNILLAEPPYAFRDDPATFDAFTLEVAHRLEVEPEAISIIGSARLGFSLNRAHLLSPFNAESDLDIVVISSNLFDATWIDLVASQSRYALLGEHEHRRFKKTKDNLFDGYMRPDQVPVSCNLSKNWFPRLATRFESSIAQLHPVQAWLFKSWDHMRHFYARYHTTIQSNIKKLLSMRGELS